MIITFFDPTNDRQARVAYLYTIDVSEVLPVPLAPTRQFMIRRRRKRGGTQMSEKTSATTLRLPRLAAPVFREAPAHRPDRRCRARALSGRLQPLRGIARDMCYRARARRRI